jgi:pentatricopeptide repeat protein
LKRYREAVIALQEARRIEPDNEYDIRLSGEACRELGWDEEAIKCFEELIQRYEKFSDVEKNKSYLFTSTLTNVAPLYAKAGRYHEALETYKLMLKLRPNLWTAHHGLGVTYLGLGDKESAMVEYEWLIKFAGDTEAKFVKQAAQKDADDLLSRIRK